VVSQENHTPFEHWYGHKPDLSHLCEIGCRAFVLIQNRHNPKVYSCLVECVLIGYSLDSKAYRCYHRTSHKVFVSYHVSFIESHQLGTSSSAVPTEQPIPPTDTTTPFPAVTIEDVPDVNAPPSPLPPLPPNNTGPPRCSTRVPVPSAHCCAMEGKPYVSPTQCTVLDALDAADRVLPTAANTHATEDTLAAILSEEELTTLAAIFVAMPDNLEHEQSDDPTTYSEAMASEHASDWTTALTEEFNALWELGIYKLVPQSTVPTGRKIMCGRPVFKLKCDQHSKAVRFKARYVCRSYSAVWGQDYTKTSAPTAHLESFRILTHLGVALDWEIDQIDIKTVFLPGLLESDEVCYMSQPEGFVKVSKEDWVWELQKGLYRMKQGGLVWNRTMNDAMLAWGFKRLKCEHCICFRRTDLGILLVAVHIDDFLTVGSTKGAILHFKNQLRTKWSVSDLGNARFCLGIALECDRTHRMISLSQTALIDQIIN
jgi:hypothetical protein